MAPRLFPPLLLREQSSRIRLIAVAISSGRTAAGVQPIIAADGGGLWSIEYSGISLHTPAQIKAYRALATAMDGGATPIIVPICDRRHGPAPTIQGVVTYAQNDVPHSDDALFSDGTGYGQPVIVAKASSSAALRATTIGINLVQGGTLQGGEYFSIEHSLQGWRLYQIIRIDGTTATIRPPLRQAVPANQALEFDLPRCTMQIASQDAMVIDLELRKFASPSVSFIEAFPPVE